MAITHERTGAAFISVSTRHFSVPVDVVYRGGYLWIREDDLRCFAGFTVGMDESCARRWAKEDATRTNTPCSLYQSVLFDVPLITMQNDRHDELCKYWIRVTDKNGKLFGVGGAFFAQTLQSVDPCNVTQAGLDVTAQAIHQREENAQWSKVADDMHCAYLSGLEDKDEDEFGQQLVLLSDDDNYDDLCSLLEVELN